MFGVYRKPGHRRHVLSWRIVIGATQRLIQRLLLQVFITMRNVHETIDDMESRLGFDERRMMNDCSSEYLSCKRLLFDISLMILRER